MTKKNIGTKPIEKFAEPHFSEWFNLYQESCADETGAVPYRTDAEVELMKKAFFAGWSANQKQPEKEALLLRCPGCKGLFIAMEIAVDGKPVKGYECLHCGNRIGPRMNIADLGDWQKSIIEGLVVMVGPPAGKPPEDPGAYIPWRRKHARRVLIRALKKAVDNFRLGCTIEDNLTQTIDVVEEEKDGRILKKPGEMMTLDLGFKVRLSEWNESEGKDGGN